MCVSFGHQLGHYQLWRSVIYSMWEWRAPTSNMVDIGQATCWTSPDQQTSPNTSQHDTPVPPPLPPWWLKTFPGLTLSWVACHCIWKALRGRETVTRVVVVGVAWSVCVCVLATAAVAVVIRHREHLEQQTRPFPPPGLFLSQSRASRRLVTN